MFVCSQRIHSPLRRGHESEQEDFSADAHESSRANSIRDVIALNFGWRHILNDHAIWLCSLGHEIHSVDQQPLAFIGSFGVQLVY